MIVFRIVGIAILSSIFILVIKQEKPEIAFLLSLVTGLIILILILGQVGEIINLLRDLAVEADIEGIYFNTILRIIGLAYIGEFGAQITRDAGEQALASKIELAVKVIIMYMAIPLMISLIETIINFLP